MTTDRDHRYLTYIRDAIVLIESRTATGRDAFLGNLDMQDAVLWRLETLAEALKVVIDEELVRPQ